MARTHLSHDFKEAIEKAALAPFHGEGVMEKEGKKTGRPRTHGTASERVQAWRLRSLRKVYRTEVLLSVDDAAKLDIFCQRQGLDRSSLIRELIWEASVSG
ncbi:MAG: hypothetical protein M1537_07120 [Nitrospirae bacterium]|nr:hypothetical protein [Nitrospirota bacterium]